MSDMERGGVAEGRCLEDVSLGHDGPPLRLDGTAALLHHRGSSLTSTAMLDASRRISLAIAPCALALLVSSRASAQAPALSPEVRQFVTVDAPVLALTNVRVIDGTGAPTRDRQTIIVQGGKIRAEGTMAQLRAGAQTTAGLEEIFLRLTGEEAARKLIDVLDA